MCGVVQTGGVICHQSALSGQDPEYDESAGSHLHEAGREIILSFVNFDRDRGNGRGVRLPDHPQTHVWGADMRQDEGQSCFNHFLYPSVATFKL